MTVANVLINGVPTFNVLLPVGQLTVGFWQSVKVDNWIFNFMFASPPVPTRLKIKLAKSDVAVNVYQRSFGWMALIGKGKPEQFAT